MQFNHTPVYPASYDSAIERHPLTITPQTTLEEAIALMNQHQKSCALVVEESHPIPTLVGTFTERDVVALASTGQLGRRMRSKISTVMSPGAIAISQSEAPDIWSAYELLTRHQIQHLPVVDERGRLVGLVTQESLLRQLSEQRKITEKLSCLQTNCTLNHLPTEAKSGACHRRGLNEKYKITEKEEIKGRFIEDSFSLSPLENHLASPAQSLNVNSAETESSRFRFLIQNRLVDIIYPDYEEVGKAQLQREGERGEFLNQHAEPEEQKDRQFIIDAQLAQKLISLQSSILDRVRSAVIATDAAGKIIYWNKFAETLYQWSATEVIGRSVMDVLCPVENKLIAEEIIEELLQKGLWEGEFVVQRKDGTTFVAMVKDSVIKNQQGLITGIVGISVDITERQQAEVAMRQSEERWRQLVETMNEGLVACNADGAIAYVNQKFSAMLGYAQAELIGRQYWHFIASTDRHILQKQIAKCYAGESSSYEIGLTRQDGQKMYAIASISPIQNSRGEVKGWFSTIADITERKRAEEQLEKYRDRLENQVQIRTGEHTKANAELQKANERLQREIVYRKLAVSSLRESERLIQKINDTTPNIVYLYDLRENRPIYLNRQFTQLLGYSLDRLHTQGIKFLTEKLHPNDRKILEDFPSQLATAKDGDVIETQYRIKHAGGEWRWMNSRNVVFARDSDGMPQQILGTVADITQRKQAEEALSASEERYRAFVAQSSEAIYCVEFEPPVCIAKQEAKQIQQIFQNGYIAECNDVMAKTYGFNSASDMLGLSFGKIVPATECHNIEKMRAFIRSGYRIDRAECCEVDAKENQKYFLNNMVGIVEEGFLVRMWGTQLDITALQQAQQALRESEARYRLLAENATDLISRHSPDGIFLYVSPACRSLLGREPEEMIGHSIYEMCHPDDVEAVAACHAALLEQPGDRTVSYRVRRKHPQSALSSPRQATWANEDYIWFETTSRIVRNSTTGKAIEIVAVSRDITRRKRSEEALRQSEEKFRQLAASVDQVFWIASRDANQILYVSPAYQTLSGRTCESLYEQPTSWFDAIHPADRRRIQVAIAKQNRDRSEFDEELRIIRPDGTIRWVWARSFLIRNDKGDIYRRTGIVADITERKQMQEALLVTQQQLQYLLSSSPAVIYSANLSGNYAIKFISENVSTLLGYEPKQFLENEKFWSDRIHPEDLESVLAEVPKLLECGHRTRDYRMLHKDGTYRWLRNEMRLIRDAATAPVELVGYWADITTQKAAEEEIHKALAKEKELSQLRSRFITLTSHEFRTPLCTILSSADLMEYYVEQAIAQTQSSSGSDRASSKLLDHVQRIQTAALHLTQMLNDILVIGKADAGALSCNRAPIDLENFCRQLVEEHNLSVKVLPSQPTGASHPITFICHTSCPDAVMDEKLLRHVLGNLLSNAIKYSPQDGEVRFELTCVGNGESDVAIFRIHDSGIGIPPEDRARIFESFYRGSNVGNKAGTGLGLAIVKKAVDVHGGHISLDSEVGVGTTFTVILPLRA